MKSSQPYLQPVGHYLSSRVRAYNDPIGARNTSCLVADTGDSPATWLPTSELLFHQSLILPS
jgi:hypothetical protein